MTMKTRLVSVWTALVLLCTLFAGTGALTASAEELPTVEVDRAWIAQWTREEGGAAAMLNITQTGFYQFRLIDYEGGGITLIAVYDLTNDRMVGYIEESLSKSYQVAHNAMYLVAGHSYQIVAYKTDQTQTRFYGGHLAVTPVMASAEVGALTTETAADVFTSTAQTWLRFTSDEEGDYCFLLSGTAHAYVAAYEVDTGYAVDQFDASYKRAVLKLKANTEYYIGVYNRVDSTDDVLSVTPCDKTVETVYIDEPLWRIYPTMGNITENAFSYRVVYTDDSEEILPYTTLASQGRRVPTVVYLGDTVEIMEAVYYEGGRQPVMAVYDDEVSYTSVIVMPLHTYSERMPEVFNVPSHWYAQDRQWMFEPETTGVYTLATDNAAAFDMVEYSFVDEHNKYVYYNDSKGGFPLVGGQQYMLVFFATTSASANIAVQRVAAMPFPDTGANAWYSDAVTYAVGAGIMTGYQNGLFGTSDGIQRQDFLVMLARLDGVDLSYYADMHGQFPDVAADSYYEAAVMWGYANGITSGYNNGEFGVGDKITREQLVTMLYSYAKYRYIDVSTQAGAEEGVAAQYTDYVQVSAYAKEPIVWAIENGVISGKKPTVIAPQGNAQRCEVAQMMYGIFKNNVF